MEKQNQLVSLLTLLPNGKVENDVRITDKTVTGICTVYLSRADDENAFFLRDIGVALIGSDLTTAVRLAVDQAYEAAVSHLAAVMPAAVQQPVIQAAKTAVPAIKQVPAKQSAPVVRVASSVPPTEAEAETEDEPEHPPVDLNSIVILPGQDKAETVQASPAPQGMTGEPVGEGIQRLDLTENLFGQSDTQENANTGDTGEDGDGGDQEYQTARETVINIFGKLHVCNGWKAGRILDEQPDVIVDFCQRNSESADGPKYTGPRTDQVAALMKLFPDAALKIQKAA